MRCTSLMPVSVSWPAKEPSFSASAIKGLSRGASSAVIERRPQRRLVNEPAARAIDDAYALADPGKRLGVKNVLGFFGERRVQRDEVGAPQQLLQLDLFHPQAARRPPR